MDTITTTASLLMSNGSAQPVMVALMPNEAALIAAAPDLYDALEAMVALDEMTSAGMGWSSTPEVAIARAALAKARGAS